MTKIRKTTLKDFGGIYNLLKSEDMVIDQFNKKRFERMFNKNGDYYFVALDNNSIVGSIFASEDGGY